MTPEPLLEEFARHLRVERGLSDNTLLTYGYQLKGYVAFLSAAEKDVLAATKDDILAYLEAKKKRGRRSATLFACAIALRQFHRFLKEQGHARMDAAQGMRLPKFRQHLPDPLSIAEMDRLLAAARGTKFHLVRTCAMLELMYATGMRVSELAGLAMGQINLEEGWVRVLGKGGRERVLPAGSRAKGALLLYLEARNIHFPDINYPIFLTSRGRPISRSVFWCELRRLARRAGLKGAVHPHQIRHSAATAMLEGGADIRVVQEMLGHRSVSTTMIYTHVSSEFLRRACQKAHPAFQR